MRCQVLLINRGRVKLFKKANYGTSTIEAKVGLRTYKKYRIPQNSKFLELEKRIGTIPLFIVDELTHNALSWSYVEETNNKSGILISQKDDPTTEFKLNVLAKTSFWEMLSKKLKMGLTLTLIYLSAGAGIGLMLLYVIKIIFLKESSI